jgi:TorA maturation chaperone TorD
MTVEAAARVQVHRPLPAEEQGRADFYALLGGLVQAAPDQRLLAAIAAADAIPAGGDAALAKAWANLAAASSVMDPEAVRDEFAALFEGVGSAQVSVYAGFYVGATAVDHPRVRIQNDVAAFGLAARDGVTEPEDHWAALFEVMRVLVAGGAGRAPAPLAEQRRFFQSHLEPGAAKFFRALQEAPSANYYRQVAALGLAVVALETESFHLD